MVRQLRIFISFVICLSLAVGTQPANAQRHIAVTIDDLPVVSTGKDIKTSRHITKKLLGHITKANLPAIGFVNENKLYADDRRDEAQIALLRPWLDAGLELGNHTFSHRSLNNIELKDYQADILRGEIITKELLQESNRRPR